MPKRGSVRHFGRFGHLPWAAQMMRFDFETYLPEDILTKVDRMSMAHSIESRVPLLDNEVVDFSARLPADLKVRNGRRKHILKEAAAKWLPQEVLTRRKQGFAVPVGSLVPEQSSRLLLGRPALGARARARLLRAAIRRTDTRRTCHRTTRSHASSVGAGDLRVMASPVSRPSCRDGTGASRPPDPRRVVRMR